MADFTQIIQEINDDINTNGVGAITGVKLNTVLRDMISAVNAEKQDKLTIYTEDVENERAEINTSLFSVNAEFMRVLCSFFSLYFSDETGLEVTTTSNSCSFQFNGEEFVVKYEDKWLLSFSKTGFRVQLHDGEDPYSMTFDIYNGLEFGDVNIGMRLDSLQQNKQDTISDLDTIRSGAAAGATAYQKPSGGIPKTDLASGVQTSLGKADTAFQKPSGGIPASDLSTAVQTSLGKADTAVQQVTVGTTTTGNAGTNASVTNSGTATAPVLNFTIPRGADGQDGQDAINPFKGWWPNLATLKAAHTATEGDSAYVKDASPATTWSIYVYDSTASTDNYWADSGTDADTSNVQTFASGEEVNEVGIDNIPIYGSDNIVKSGGIFESISKKTDVTIPFDLSKIALVNMYIVASTKKWNNVSNRKNYQIPQLEEGTVIRITGNSSSIGSVGFLSSYVPNPTQNANAPIIGDIINIPIDTVVDLVIPSGASVLYIFAGTAPLKVELVYPINKMALKLNTAYTVVEQKDFNIGDTVFTKDDVKDGSDIYYDFDTNGNTAIYIALYDSDDNRLAFIGKASSTWSLSHYNGIITIPRNFDHAIVSGNESSQAYISVNKITSSEIINKITSSEIINDNKYFQFSPTTISGYGVSATDGVLYVSQNQKVTNWIQLPYIKKILVYAPMLGSQSIGIAFYKSPSAYDFLSGVNFSDTYTSEKHYQWMELEVPEGALWFRFSNFAESITWYEELVVKFVLDDYVIDSWKKVDETMLPVSILRNATVISDFNTYKYAFSGKTWIYGGNAYVAYDQSTELDADTPANYDTIVPTLSKISLFDKQVTRIYPQETAKTINNESVTFSRTWFYTPVLVGNQVAATVLLVRTGQKNPLIAGLISDMDDVSLATREYTVCRLHYNNGTEHDVEYDEVNYRQMVYDMGWGDLVTITADAFDYNALAYSNGVYYAVVCSTPSGTSRLPLVLLTSTDCINWTATAKIGTSTYKAAEISIAIMNSKIYISYRTTEDKMGWVVCGIDGSFVKEGLFPVTRIMSRPYTFIYMDNVYMSINLDPTVFGKFVNADDYTHEARNEVGLFKMINDTPVLMRRLANPTGVNYPSYCETPPFVTDGNILSHQGALYMAFSEDRAHLYKRQFANMSFCDITPLFANNNRIDTNQ